jgi:hypothetical protein
MMSCLSVRFSLECKGILRSFPNYALRNISPQKPWNGTVYSTSKFVLSDKQQNQQQLAKPKLAERLVDGCPKPMQPYLRLMRIDRPIGMNSPFFKYKTFHKSN